MNSPVLMAVMAIFLFGCQTTSKTNADYKQPMKAVQDNNEVLATNMSFDLEKGEIRYTLPEEAFVRVRVGVQDGGAMVDTLVDWELQEAGEHTASLDWKTENGKKVFSQRNDLMAVIACLRPVNSQMPEYSTTVGGLRKSPDFDITFPEASRSNEAGVPVIEGVVTVRIFINPKDVKWLTESKYEIGMYIDGIFFVEDEEGTNPYNYRLDTGALNNGPHSITVNITSYTGEMGTKNILAYIDNQPGKQ